MEEPAGPFHVLRTGTGRFLCYCGPDGAVYVTDAMEVWAGELGGCPALGFVAVPAGGARRDAQGRPGSRSRRAEPGPGFGHAAAAGGAAVPGPSPRPAARRRGAQPAAGAGLRHGRLHREPGEAPGSSGDVSIFLQP